MRDFVGSTKVCFIPVETTGLSNFVLDNSMSVTSVKLIFKILLITSRSSHIPEVTLFVLLCNSGEWLLFGLFNVPTRIEVFSVVLSTFGSPTANTSLLCVFHVSPGLFATASDKLTKF